MKKHYKTTILIFFLTFFSATLLHAQEIVVSGTVTDDKDGTPIPGVNIQEKGTFNGSITDMDGHFEIKVQEGATLIFSFIGFASQEVEVGNQTTLNVRLLTDVKQLEEIIVIGYGEVEKEDLTGSITAVSSEDFNKGVISSPQDLLTGKIAGVQITSNSGAPGSGSTIRIRGGSSLRANNDPLIVINGVPLENSELSGSSNTLSTINPNDIETFTVLKDASATAIYGSRASNGVILITTKKGTKDKLRLSYNGYASLSTPSRMHDVYTGDEFRALVQDRVDNHGLTSAALDNLGEANTNWQDEIYDNAFSQSHNISVSGAVKDVPVRVALGYTNEKGILKYSSMKRNTFDVSLDPSLLEDYLKLNLNVRGAYTDNNFSNTDAIGSSIQFDPTMPVKNGNTRYGGYTAWTELSSNDPLNGPPNNIANHNPVAQVEYRDNTSRVNSYIMSGKAEYKLPFLPEMKATINVGYDYSHSKGFDITDTLGSWTYREPENSVKRYMQTKKNTLMDFYLNYQKDLEFLNSHIDVMGGYSYQHFYKEKEDAKRPWVMTDNVYENADTTLSKSEYFLISFFGRLNYTIKDKYFITATLRDDGASRFSKEHRWGLFPAFAFAWKINEEPFMQNIRQIDNLKLRLGYGKTGQQDISKNFYPYIKLYTLSQQGAYYQFGDTFSPTLRPEPYDPNIQWETTSTKNIGLDFALFKERIVGYVDLYHKETVDLLNEVPIAAGTNFTDKLITNVGSLENKGIEFGLTGRIIATPEILWEVSANFTYNQGKITKLTLIEDPNYPGYPTGEMAGGSGNNAQINAVGYPAETYYFFKQVYGQDKMPIEGLYVDKTGLGGNVAGNEDNKYHLQNPAADYTIGLSSNASYKNVIFSFSGRFNFDNYVYNNNASNMGIYQNIYNQSGYRSNILTDVERTKFMTAQFWSDFYLENASFFRMDNMNLGYNFNKLFTEKLTGQVSLTVQNVFVITNYTGIDPEVDKGVDKSIYPRPRTYLLGLILNF